MMTSLLTRRAARDSIEPPPRRSSARTLRIALMYAVGLAFLFPFYVAVVYAFKSPEETTRDPLGLPPAWRLDNFVAATKIPYFFTNILNSVIVTVSVVTVTVLICSMAGYIVTRRKSKVYSVIYYLFLLSILVPFQTIMFPLYVQLRSLGLINSLLGIIIVQIGVQVGYFAFLYAGFIKTIPVELEEAARLDGASRFTIFFRIVFPLLRPINLTVIVLAALGSWNDFLAPLMLLQKEDTRTLPLVQFYFFGQYSQQVNLAFAAAIVSMIPILILYFVLQRYIVSGMSAGAVKG
ncbi:carbohydrate ABC transporter permease [Leifsonia sp. 22587]|uniref:carbohydrate ABC transporter permease n=1 Tax=Leifsonia sp. 22587 TaxID=3453946 RepID=UPI003F854C40